MKTNMRERSKPSELFLPQGEDVKGSWCRLTPFEYHVSSRVSSGKIYVKERTEPGYPGTNNAPTFN